MSKKTFAALGLPESLCLAVSEKGYSQPTSIQAESIPYLLDGRDVLAQAETGTGKTAAFALPTLARVDVQRKVAQVLVVAPTRELAIQVAEGFQRYATHVKGLRVASIYGGQDYQVQIKALKQGAHVVVGTPGRLMDHIKRGKLHCDAIHTLVLDEADEMLKMGFIDDVEWILSHLPEKHQTALFSATLPKSIQKIANNYLDDPHRIVIKGKKRTVPAIEQTFMCVAQGQKVGALACYLEVEETDGVIIFVRTKSATADLAERLQARGYSAAALNGDMNQAARKRAVNQLKAGGLDVVVATDVAARGIDIDRISHVVNFDSPHDTETYLHRIGRTGRAGRKGKALLLTSARGLHELERLERELGQPLVQVNPPSIEQLAEKRAEKLAERVAGIVEKSKKFAQYRHLLSQVVERSGCSFEDVAVALMAVAQDGNPLPREEVKTVMMEKPKRNSRGKNFSRAKHKSRSNGRRR